MMINLAVEAILADTLIKLYLRAPSQNAVFLSFHKNSLFLHSRKRPAPVTGTFIASRAGCLLTRTSTVLFSRDHGPDETRCRRQFDEITFVSAKCQDNSPEQGRNWSNLHRTVDNWTKPLKTYKPWYPCQHLFLRGTVQFLSDPDDRPHEELSCLLFYDRSKKTWKKYG